METTIIVYRGDRGYIGLYRGYTGIMERKWKLLYGILGLYRDPSSWLPAEPQSLHCGLAARRDFEEVGRAGLLSVGRASQQHSATAVSCCCNFSPPYSIQET